MVNPLVLLPPGTPRGWAYQSATFAQLEEAVETFVGLAVREGATVVVEGGFGPRFLHERTGRRSRRCLYGIRSPFGRVGAGNLWALGGVGRALWLVNDPQEALAVLGSAGQGISSFFMVSSVPNESKRDFLPGVGSPVQRLDWAVKFLADGENLGYGIGLLGAVPNSIRQALGSLLSLTVGQDADSAS